MHGSWPRVSGCYHPATHYLCWSSRTGTHCDKTSAPCSEGTPKLGTQAMALWARLCLVQHLSCKIADTTLACNLVYIIDVTTGVCAGMTLQSGMVIDFKQLQESYSGQCCLPRTILNDYSPVMRIDNSEGMYYVTSDPACAAESAIPSTTYPASFEYIRLCGSTPASPGAPVSSGSDMLSNSDIFMNQPQPQPNTIIQTDIIVDGGKQRQASTWCT